MLTFYEEPFNFAQSDLSLDVNVLMITTKEIDLKNPI